MASTVIKKTKIHQITSCQKYLNINFDKYIECLNEEVFTSAHFAKLSKKAKIKRYIFNSTCSVYGFSNKKVFENGAKKPISTYAKANLKA